MSDNEGFFGLDLFHEDEPPLPEPVFETFRRVNGSDLSLRLVGQSPLWGHLLWSAGKIMANYLDQNSQLMCNKVVLELGAAAALPSIICALNKALLVIATDYPDQNLIENIQYNFDHIKDIDCAKVHAHGYIWGRSPDELLRLTSLRGFDLILLSDLVFNHQAHHDLLQSCKRCLARTDSAQILVFFTHHRPHLAHKDNEFLKLAKDYSFKVEKIIEDVSESNVMFDADQGSRLVRATVHGYRFTHDFV